MTARSITLTASQVRIVLLGLAGTDDQRRGFAVGVIADALLAADGFEPATPVLDVERERRREAVELAAAELVGWWAPQERGLSTRERKLNDAVADLCEYAPAEISAPVAVTEAERAVLAAAHRYEQARRVVGPAIVESAALVAAVRDLDVLTGGKS